MDPALRRALAERLASFDDVAEHPSAQLPLARSEIRRVTEGWRELLTAHLPDRRGRCPVCSGWVRRRRWPCPVWLAAHRRLLGEDHQGDGPPGARANGDRRPPKIEVIERRPAVPEPRPGDPVQPGTQVQSAAVINRARE